MNRLDQLREDYAAGRIDLDELSRRVEAELRAPAPSIASPGRRRRVLVGHSPLAVAAAVLLVCLVAPHVAAVVFALSLRALIAFWLLVAALSIWYPLIGFLPHLGRRR